MDPAAFTIPDSTDWLGTPLAAFSALEQTLRCQVCKDFFNTPMITSCSHTFCSLCIRRCFAADGRCPTCRSPDQDSKLRRNGTAQELVEWFQAARPQALELARQSAAGNGAEEEGTKRSKGVKRKLAEVGDMESEEQLAADRTSTPVRKTRSQARRSATSSQTPEVIEIDDDDDGASDFVEEGEEAAQPNDGLVACPMCNERMKEELVFPHLDRCDGPKASSQSTRTRQGRMATPSHPLQQRSRNTPTFSRKQEPLVRLPQLNYSILKDQSLRKKLADLGIPNTGTRSQLTRRHTEWINVWNANVDSLRPRTKRELLSELDKWERCQAMESGGLGSGSSGAQVMKKDFDGDGWAKTNKSHFDELIASARAKRAAPKEKKQGDSEAAATNGTSGLPGPQRPNAYENNTSPLDEARTISAPSLPHPDSDAMDGVARNSGSTVPADPSLTHASTIPSSTIVPPAILDHYPIHPSALPARLGSPDKALQKSRMFEVPSDAVMDRDTEQK